MMDTFAIFTVIERFAAIKLQVENIEHSNIENTNILMEDTRIAMEDNDIIIEEETQNIMDEDNDIIIEQKTQNIMDKDNDISVAGIEDSNSSNDEIQQSAEATCHIITVGNWKISQFDDDSPNIYRNIIDNTITHIKPSEILEMEQKYDTFVPEFCEQHNRNLYLMNYHIM